MRTWLFRLGYLAGALLILALEIVAIIDPADGDTITENVRLVVLSGPFAWSLTLGATVGLLAWMVRHFWWNKQ